MSTPKAERPAPTTPAFHQTWYLPAERPNRPSRSRATADTIDDDGESVKITFGARPTQVDEGATKQTIVSITDDDLPEISVSYGNADVLR